MKHIYTFRIYYKFKDDNRVATLLHTMLSDEDFEQAGQAAMSWAEEMLREFDAVPVGITFERGDTLEN